MIEISSLSKTYGNKANAFKALDDITLSIDDGETVAIVGKSGSGKSTLMHVMSGLDHSTEGTIRINDTLLGTMSPREMDAFRAHTMSFIFQSFFVQGNESCYDNVSLPLEISELPQAKRKQRIDAALAAVELSGKAASKAKNLSGGQKQRLAIARAIVSRPKILFADEPTGNLDSVTGEKIEELLFDYAKKEKATLIIVTHDSDLAKKCAKQVYMKDGRIEKVVGGKK